MNPAKSKNLILIVLALVFIAPGLLAVLFYYNPFWLPNSHTNQGRLLNPPILMNLNSAVESTSSHSSGSRNDSTAEFRMKEKNKVGQKSKWVLALWSPTTCNTACLKMLNKLARVRLALGRRLYEVDIQLVLGASAKSLSQSEDKLLHEQDINFVRLQDNLQRDSRLFPSHRQVFLVNPDHYAILTYDPNWEPKAIYQDLKLLLKTGVTAQ